VKIKFPYPDFDPLNIPDSYKPQIFDLAEVKAEKSEIEIVKKAIENPIESKPLRLLAAGKKRVLIVAEDISRPTEICEFVNLVLDELTAAGVKDSQIEFIMALGTHRYMTEDEIAQKLGSDVAKKFKVHNHDWKNPECLKYIGDTDQAVPVWINKLVSESDLVIGLGSIIPIDICGFTGGGKILVPGVSGQITVDQMHWTRIDVPSHHILGKADNPIRTSIDSLARKAGLDFILNVILNADGKIAGAVAGDMVAAHRTGCRIAKKIFAVNIPRKFDIVIADSHPFDSEFWQANKALDTAGEVVRKGGVVILVSPCDEGFSRSHPEILEFGYLPVKTIKDLVNSGKIKHKVVGVHMIQASTVAVEKAKLILVSTGITKTETEKVGFLWAKTVQQAFEQAVQIVGNKPAVAVLKNASRMLPLVNE